jgi:hypothetical protein
MRELAGSDTHPTPTTPDAGEESHAYIHTIPHEQTQVPHEQSPLDPPPSTQETPPSSLET